MRMHEEMNRLFSQFFREGDGKEGTWLTEAWAPPVDIRETDEALILKAELPGFSRDGVHIELHNNRLTLRGKRKHETEVKEVRYHRRERAYGSFQRSFQLPAAIDQEQVTAGFKNGLAEWRLPKSEAAKPKRITIAGAETPTQMAPGATAAQGRGMTKSTTRGR
jgi:HSP20 family protein